MAATALPQSRRYVWCEIHSKRAWIDQTAADAAIARLTERDTAEQADRMHIYPCGIRAGLHVGHKPGAIAALDRLQRAGEAS